MNLLLELFGSFAKIGTFTFGGGYAMLSVIENICVERKKWITHEDMLNITVIAESTPGPIAVNCATFVGYKQKGLAGALAATFGVVLPSFVILFVISLFLDRFLEITWVASAFRGIKVAVGILILDAGIKLLRNMRRKTRVRMLILAGASLAMFLISLFSWNFSSVSLMLIAGAVSLTVFFLKERLEKKGGAGK